MVVTSEAHAKFHNDSLPTIRDIMFYWNFTKTARVAILFFFNDTATTEIYTRKIVGSVRCV